MKNRNYCYPANWSITKLIIGVFGLFLMFSNNLFAQTFVQWNDGGVSASSSGLTSITGTYPGGTVTVTNTGAGVSSTLGSEFSIVNLNGATASEIFASFGATTNPPSKSLTFTFSTPVIINSFNVHDIDKGGSWHDEFSFSGITFTSVAAFGGVFANGTGITTVPTSNGSCTEYAYWSTSTASITSFSIDYAVTAGTTHAYLGYSMEVTQAVAQSIDIVGDTTLCVGDSILLTAVNDTSYSWALTTAPNTIISTDSAIYVSPVVNTSYVVYGTSDTAYHTISVNEPIQPFSLGNDTIICPGETVLLDGTSPYATTYLWQDGSANPTFLAGLSGVYWVEVSNSCSSEVDSLTVSAVVLNIDLGPDLLLCPDEDFTLDAGIIGNTYLWSDGSTNQTLTATSPGVYWVNVEQGSCNDSDTVQIDKQILTPIFSAPDREECELMNFNADFMDQSTVNFGNIVEWDWSLGNGEESTIQNPSSIYNTPGSYDVELTITSNLGCTESITYPGYITVHPNPTASFSYGSNSGIALEITEFVNTSVNSVDWFWDFGDTSYAQVENPSHEYLTADDFMVTLVATSSFGCHDTIMTILSVASEPVFFAPNSFTPNSDELNNYWSIHISEVDIYNFSVQIYNRWGEIIWESFDASQGWDGTYNGELVQSGVYVWVVNCASNKTDKKYTYTGNVNVLR